MTETTLVGLTPLPSGYGTLRLHVPNLAGVAAPGHHVQLGSQAWPLINASTDHGWIELFHPQPNFADQPEASMPRGSNIELGPLQGTPIDPTKLSLPAVLIADINGLASTIFLLTRAPIAVRRQCLVFLQADDAFPFYPRPSLFMLPGVPPSTTGCAPLCEDMRVPSRLASESGLPGCYTGSVADLLDGWLRLRGRGMVPQPHVYAFCADQLAHHISLVAANWEAQFHRHPLS